MNREPDRKLEHEVFEKYGEDTVRRLLREGRITNQRAVAAQSWLDEQDESRRASAERQAEAVRTEQMELARAAKDAAEAAARTAEGAARAAASARRRASVALAVSAIALSVALVGAWTAFSDAARPAIVSHAPPASR